MTGASTHNPPSEPATLRFVDTHCHLDDDAFTGDIAEVIEAASAAGVRSIVNIGYEPKRWITSIRLAERFPNVAFTLGMHPQNADAWHGETSTELVRLIGKHRPRAIGEVGIDLFRGETNLLQQQAAFDEQLDLAMQHSLPVVIHMRDAEREILDILAGRQNNPPLLFHSFDGSRELVRYIRDHGSMVGVGGLATRAKSGPVRQNIGYIPMSQIVLETDSPYLIPAKARGSKNTPQNIPVIANQLANWRSTSVEVIAAQTTANAEQFFGKLEIP
jgi:TatD DNase family protein